MKLTRIIAAFLILVLVTSQALAAACVTSCVMSDSENASLMSAQNMSTMSAEDCHNTGSDNDNHQNNHSQCNMAGCHTAQTAPFVTTLMNHFIDISNIDLPRFTPTALSADITPPIKPPA